MVVREVRATEKDKYNSLVTHPVQSWEWGEFKKSTGVKVTRLGLFDGKNMKAAFQISFHAVPKTSYTVGYFPKGPLPTQEMLQALVDGFNKEEVLFVKLEPNARKADGQAVIEQLHNEFNFRKGKAVFTPHTFYINLTGSEEELMAAMKAKTRYNVRLAQRKGVTIEEDNSDLAFETYLKLTRETSKRQRFYAHDEDYHQKMWETLHPAGIAHLLTAKYEGEILATWILFVYKDILYYPYGASSGKYRNLMASNLMMWEAMRFGKKMSCRLFDLWGSLGPKPNPKDPWYGFHRFKEGYGSELVELIGTYDLVLNSKLYPLFRLSDSLRWKWLRLQARFR